jgi:hypothetical protein
MNLAKSFGMGLVSAEIQKQLYMPQKQKKEKKGGPVAFRPTPAIEKELEEAEEVTGAKVGELVFHCVKEHLPNVVKRLLDDRHKAAQRYLKEREKTEQSGKE